MERKRIGIYLDDYISLVKRIPTEDIINKRVRIKAYTEEISKLLDKKINKLVNKIADKPSKMLDIWTFDQSFVLKVIDKNPEVINFINYKLSEEVQFYILDNCPEYYIQLHHKTKTSQVEAIKRNPEWIQYDLFGIDMNGAPDLELKKELEMISVTDNLKNIMYIENPHIDTCKYVLSFDPQRFFKYIKFSNPELKKEVQVFLDSKGILICD